MIALLDPRLWLAILVLISMAYTGGRWQQYRQDETERKADLVEAVQQVQAEYERQTKAQTEIVNDATQKAEQARIAAHTANAASVRLRQRIAALASTNPPATTSSAPAGDPIGVLADVLGRIDQRAGELAAYGDSARIAGQACELAYESLTKKE